MSKLLKMRGMEYPDGGIAEIPVRTTTNDGSDHHKRQEPPAEVEFWLAQARRDADAIIEAAEERVAAIMREAEGAAKRVEDAAKEAGYSAGYDAGYDAGRAQGLADGAQVREATLRDVAALMERAEIQRRLLISGVHGTLTAIATEATRRLLARELNLAPADVEQLVDDLLEYVIESSKIEVRVNPADFPAATAARPKWREARFGEWDVAVIPDQSVSAGGCEIRSDSGRIDARIETKLELLEQGIAKVMERSVIEYAAGLE